MTRSWQPGSAKTATRLSSVPKENRLRIVRFDSPHGPKYGVQEGEVVRGLRENPFGGNGPGAVLQQFDGSSFSTKGAKLLAPVAPSKIVGIGLNYRPHAEEVKLEIPSVPLIFLKPSTSVIGPGESILLPRGAGRVDFEGELGVVISRKAKDVPASKASDYILGYTCANDVSERHMQKADKQWTRAKGFDTFAPLGPWIETDLDPGNARLTTTLNGEVRQSASTSELIFNVAQLVEFVSGVMTLLAGDVIITGTPSGIGPIKAGDVVEVTIEGIGTLRNYVANQQ
ncbi:MAG: fumarylacetoacetate hydrolase family protein [Chloroflexi bacterium]|nr:fumarylacetoacetate hydrolase family protein [Chloroflexota bacterium]